MRELDPFSFFYNHASAIEGLGGGDMSPDPRYCFHTPYQPVRPGQASFELQLRGVRASTGELSLRVHAFRPESGENASLVAAARLHVATDGKQDLNASVRFSALRDVHYAFYGFFIEDSDMRADELKILLHEAETEEDYIEPPMSLLAMDIAPREVRPANALIHVVTPHLANPVSQDCTLAQVEELAEGKVGELVVADWEEAVCLAALRTYGVRTPALEGLIVGPCSQALKLALGDVGFSLAHEELLPLPPSNSTLFADFMVCPGGIGADTDPESRWETVRAWFARLKIGGLGVIVVRYLPLSRPGGSAVARDAEAISRNEIGKWALRLIASGYSVAPLAFAPFEELTLDGDGLAAFALIAQRQ